MGGAGKLVQAVAETAFDGAGWSCYTRISTADTNSANIKAAAGVLHGIVWGNTNASARWLKFYDKATAPTVGSDTPVLVVPLTGGTVATACEFMNLNMQFSTGIGIGIVTGITSASTAAPSANELIVNILYA